MAIKDTIEAVKESAVEALPDAARPWVPYLPAIYGVFGIVGGAAWNLATMARIDHWGTNLKLLITATLLAALLVVESRIRQRRTGSLWFEQKGEKFVAFGVLFCLSSLFNAYFVFYITSASNLKTALFGAALLGMVVATKFLKSRLAGDRVRMFAFQLATFSLFLFLIPLLTGWFGGVAFFLAAILSFFANVAVWTLTIVRPGTALRRLRGEPMDGAWWFHYVEPFEVFTNGLLWVGTLLLLVILNCASVIPPVPLALLHAGVYHSVDRTSEGYVVKWEKPSLLHFWRKQDLPFRRRGSEEVIFFTSVFAPTGSSLRIVHRWDHWTSWAKGWETAGEYAFDVTGGRSGGFRGWSKKRSVEPGYWRVVVTTDSGREIGRRKFRIVEGEGPVELRERVVD